MPRFPLRILLFAFLSFLPAGPGAGAAAAGEPPPGLQSDPALAAGGALLYAAWTDGRDPGTSRLYWTRLAAGVPDSAASPATPAGSNELHAATAAGSGWALAAWESWDADGGVRLAAATLPASGPPRLLDPVTVTAGLGPVHRPAAALGGGTAILVWEDERSGVARLRYARWDRDAGLLDPEGTAFTAGAAEQRWVSAAAGGSGFLAVWSEARPDGSWRVKAQILDAAGAPAGAPADLSGPLAFGPATGTAFSGDRYLAVWRGAGAGGGDLYGRFVSPAGAPLGPGPFLVAASADLLYSPRPAGCPGGFALLWTASGSAGRCLRRATMDTAGTVRPEGGVALTDPLDYVAEASEAVRGSTVTTAWRLPLPADDDDLMAAAFAAGDSIAAPAAVPFTVVPGPEVSAAPGISPPPAIRAVPNPFRTGVRLAGASMGIRIYDMSGRLIRALPAAGESGVRWDGRDTRGRPVPPGVYLARGSGDAAVRLVRLP